MNKYIDANQLKAEIERRRKKSASFLYVKALDDVLAILDTLPEQPDGEGLEEEIERVCAEIEEKNPQHRGLKPSGIAKIARHFAEWQKTKMLEGAVEGKVAERIQGKLYARCPIPNTMKVEFCDKVRVIFIKEDEK